MRFLRKSVANDRVILLLVALVCPGSSWTTISQARGDETSSNLDTMKRSNGAIHRLWNYPTQGDWSRGTYNATSNEQQLYHHGLEGAITFAWDPKMCAILNPLFGPDLWGFEFSSCEDIAASVRMAFDSWSANHPRFKFQDVSNDCMSLEAVGDTAFASLGGSKPCPLAEIWLTTTSEEAKDDAAAVTLSEYASVEIFRHTNGRWARHGTYATVRSTIGFKKDDICWYIDATFCNIFNRWKQTIGAGELLLWGRCLTFALWGLMLADVIWLAVDYYLKQKEAAEKGNGPTPIKDKEKLAALQRKLDKATTETNKQAAQLALDKFQREQKANESKFVDNLDSMEEWGAMMERLAKVDFSPWALRLFLVVGPILFYTQIFDPCFSCYDFQAAVTHEIGHVLGLGHPDQAAIIGDNIMIDRTEGESLALEITGASAAAYGQGDASAKELAALTVHQRAHLTECGGLANCLLRAKIDCWNPWTRTEVRPNTSNSMKAYAPTIMAAFTFNNPSTCIFQDDLDAINVLYPVCTSMATFPVCTQPKTYLGVIRFTVYVGIPVVALLILMILLNKLAYKAHQRGHEKQRRQMKDSLHLLTKDGQPISRAERKVIQWRAQIAELQMKRRRFMAAGKTIKNSEDMRKVQYDIRRKEQKIKEAEASPPNDDDGAASSDSDDDSLLENILQGDFGEILDDMLKNLTHLWRVFRKSGKPARTRIAHNAKKELAPPAIPMSSSGPLAPQRSRSARVAAEPEAEDDPSLIARVRASNVPMRDACSSPPVEPSLALQGSVHTKLPPLHPTMVPTLPPAAGSGIHDQPARPASVAMSTPAAACEASNV